LPGGFLLRDDRALSLHRVQCGDLFGLHGKWVHQLCHRHLPRDFGGVILHGVSGGLQVRDHGPDRVHRVLIGDLLGGRCQQLLVLLRRQVPGISRRHELLGMPLRLLLCIHGSEHVRGNGVRGWQILRVWRRCLQQLCGRHLHNWDRDELHPLRCRPISRHDWRRQLQILHCGEN